MGVTCVLPRVVLHSRPLPCCIRQGPAFLAGSVTCSSSGHSVRSMEYVIFLKYTHHCNHGRCVMWPVFKLTVWRRRICMHAKANSQPK